MEEERTAFAVYKEGKITEAAQVALGNSSNKVLHPFHPNNKLISKRFILFPSQPAKYGDNIELFNEIRDFVKKFVMLPGSFLSVVAVYVMMTWIYDRFRTLPYLRVVGTWGTGKTRFLEVVGSLCYKPMIAGGSVSTSAIFRTLDSIQGTFVFDEADFQNNDMWNEIIKILNAGHNTRFPVVRMEATPNGQFVTRTFDVFGPKVLGSRKKIQRRST